MIRVTVIMPVYNVEKYLVRSAESVMAQTERNIEIILVNDGSSDKSGELCEELARQDSRIRYISQQNKGVSSARNTGLRAAKGKWIYFMDPDDIIEPDTLECAVKAAESTDSDICFFDYEQVYINCTVTKNALYRKNEFVNNVQGYENLCSFNHTGSVCFMIIKSELIKDRVFFDENIRIGEDLAFRFECYCTARAYSYVPEVKYHYIARKDSAINSVRKDYAAAADRLFEKLASLKEQYDIPDYAEKYINAIYLRLFISLINNTFSSGNKMTLSEKLDAIERFACSERFKSAVCNYDPHFCGRSIKIHRHFNRILWIISYIVYLISKIKNRRYKPF